jgi:small conductance mechanosensitive channel
MDLAAAPDQLSALAAMVWTWALAFLPRLGAALAILVIGVLLAGWAARFVRRLVGRTGRIDATVQPILTTVARYAVLILVIVVALAQLGVQTASLLAVLGAAGLAIGLALQGTLQNIAAGIMLIYLRPFQVGDTIETPAIAGTVREIGLFATEMETGDGLFYFVPNSEIWNKPLKNHSRNPRRLMTIPIRIGTGADPDAARRVLLEMAAADPRILQNPAATVHLETYTDNAAVMSFRAWAPTSVFWDAQRTMTEEARRRLQAAGIDLA